MPSAAQSGTALRPLGAFADYEPAQRLVDELSDRQFPVQHLTIVGRDLRLVERVLGRLTVARAALSGALSGAWFGFFVGVIFWIVSPWLLAPVLWGVFLGASFGAIYGAISHAATGGRRDFASVRSLVAGRYEVLVDEPYAEQAQRLLATHTDYPPFEAPSPDRTRSDLH